ncbi:hypothetical protein DL546_009807 [Coniochaeta pulveracea]|uniref:Uncharacterized protein n=1 Tax=Coniochaeta pulveracea TaxID=177199 RepID=A0A420YP69_9PEZI|nr:hypothetical protein DL546_009807 [Coniochaeta pulveracea]
MPNSLTLSSRNFLCVDILHLTIIIRLALERVQKQRTKVRHLYANARAFVLSKKKKETRVCRDDDNSTGAHSGGTKWFDCFPQHKKPARRRSWWLCNEVQYLRMEMDVGQLSGRKLLTGLGGGGAGTV